MVFFLLLACVGCAQHDLFHPGSLSSGEAAGRLLFRSPPADLCSYGGGTQVVRVDVDTHGNVTHVESLSGKQAGREAFRRSVQQWKYKPLEHEGKTVPFSTTISASVSCGR